MFRPVGIVVAFSRCEAYFFAAGLALAAGFALADLAGLAALVVFLAVVFGAAFFVAISLAPLRKNFGYRFGKHVVSLWYPMQRDNSNSRHPTRG